jgi:formate-dependent nitrite reductase membrane component NrfD
MSENPIIIAGIPIPFRNPALLGVLAIHVLAALASVITGIIAMVSMKGPGRHSFFGTMYYWSLSVVLITALVLAVFRWTEDYYLAILGTLAFTAALLGRAAFRSRWQFRVQAHISGMGLSYTLMLVAFYMDNGRNLPLWRDLPAVTYWLAPGGTGAVLIIYAMLRYTGKKWNT